MPLNPLDLVLLDNVTATGAGAGIGFATEMRYGTLGGGASKPNQNEFPKKMKVFIDFRDTVTGATATLAIQDSADGITYVTRYSQPLAIPAAAPFSQGKRFLFSTQKQYVRANLTALAGGSAPKVNAFLTAGTFGA